MKTHFSDTDGSRCEDLTDWKALGAESVVLKLKEFCFSQESAGLLTPGFLFETDERRLDELESVLSPMSAFFCEAGTPAFSLKPVRETLERAAVAGVRIEPEEAAAVWTLTDACCRLNRFFRTKTEETALNAEAVEILQPFFDFPLAEELRSAFLRFLNEAGELRSDLPELTAADRRIAQARSRLLTAARACFERYGGSCFASETETIRSGRVVLPVKADFSGKIKGIVHESSSTGATVFIEPQELVEFNNRLTEAANEKQAALAAVFRRLSALVSENRGTLSDLRRRMEIWDLLQARCRFHLAFKTVFVKTGAEIFLSGVTHPQLGKSAVPLTPGACRRCNVISGPNAGGKSVLLKSIGLAVFCRQSGLGVFADGCTRLPFFRNILCDIGDRQSISEALSTFSAHLNRMKRILESAGGNSLVLLDEFASGTDPLEGGALGLALLNALKEKGSAVFLTTHNGLIKERALLSPDFSAFAMAFDSQVMRPSYAVIPDAAGEAHAIDIAAVLELPDSVLSEARLFFEKEIPETAKLMNELLDKRRELALRETAVRKEEAALKERERALALKEIVHRADVYRLKSEQKAGVAAEVRRLRQEVRELSQKSRTPSAAVIKDLETQLSHFNEKARRLKEAAAREEAAVLAANRHVFSPGEEVFVGESRQRAVLVRPAGKGKWLAETGSLRLTVKEADLKPCAPSPKIVTNAAAFFRCGTAGAVSSELDLRGMTGDEAVAALESYVDRLILAGLHRFSVIHGTGEGILQKRVRGWLQSCRYVESFEFARPECGGFGKTEAVLKG